MNKTNSTSSAFIYGLKVVVNVGIAFSQPSQKDFVKLMSKFSTFRRGGGTLSDGILIDIASVKKFKIKR